MTHLSTPTAPDVTAAPKPANAPRSGLRRHRGAIIIGAGLVAAVALAVVGRSDQQYDTALDPQNADPVGARAVAQVLEDQGVDVAVVRDAAAFTSARADSQTLVLVSSPDDLGRTTAEQVRDRSRTVPVLVVAPSAGIARILGGEDGVSYGSLQKVRGRCGDPRFDSLELETRSGTVYAPSTGACFGLAGGALLTSPSPGLQLLGAADLLSNEQVGAADNAAIALQLLGERDRLLWYVPDPGDVGGDDGVSVRSLLPAWTGAALLLVALAILGLMFWRGRRLGPLAVEPLPVSITAIETTRSRGRLYRKTNDRGHAAAALRRSTRTELAEQMLLPRHTAEDVDLLVRVLVPHTLRDAAQLRQLLHPQGPVPANDRDLITLANDLAELTREVRR